MRLIDRDLLFQQFEAAAWYNNADRDEVAERLLLDAPTIEARPVVRGEWDEDKYSFCNYCTQCGLIIERGCIKWKTGELNYRPNCGADMRGEDDG